MCKYCTGNDDDWDYKTININGGALGKFELIVSVEKLQKSLVLYFSQGNNDPMWDHSLKIKYCPFCGEKL